MRFTFTDPLFLLLLRQQDGSTKVLANPRIRVKNKEKARIHIGDRVPVITTTAAATGGFVSESVNYLDVGLKLEVEPLIHLEDEVGIKVGLEVSNIAREVRSANSNTLTYQIGTRNAATMLRLRDGETQILAGLISDEERAQREPRARPGRPAGDRAPVLADARQQRQDRDRAAHHAAPGAHAGAARSARGRVRRRHRGFRRRRHLRPAAAAAAAAAAARRRRRPQPQPTPQPGAAVGHRRWCPSAACSSPDEVRAASR